MNLGRALIQHPVLLLVGFLALVGAGTVWLLVGGPQGVAIATVLALTAAVLTLAAPLFGVLWGSPDQTKLEEEARKLARAVAKRETAEQNRFLADSARGTPADINFDAPQLVSWPDELVIWRHNEGPQSGSLTNIVSFYAGAPSHAGIGNGRLVVLGEPGAGKTVLVNQLLLDLITRQLASDPGSGEQRRVPIRLSLPSFDPGTGDVQIGDAAVASQFDAWIKDQLVKIYELHPRVANALVDDDRILPVLDGLDEMDVDTSDAAHAAATVRALNYSSSGGVRPFVITCRNDRYKQLAASASTADPGQEPVLNDATVIELQPLSVAQVKTYLVRRFPDGADRSQIQSRWQRVFNHLQPGSPLAAALGSPLRLFMAVTAYYYRDSKPAELCELPADAIGQHLLQRFVPAVCKQHPLIGGDRYDPNDVTRWLGTLARYLQIQQHDGGSGSDIDLTALWIAAGQTAPRRRAAALYGLLTGLAALGAGAIYLAHYGHVASDLLGRGAIVIFAALIIFVMWRASRPGVQLIRFDVSRLRTASGRRELALGVATGFMIGAYFGGVLYLYDTSIPYYFLYHHGFVTASKDIFITGLAGALAGGVASRGGLSRSPAAISRPSDLIIQGVVRDVAVTLAIALSFSFWLGFAPTFVFGSASALVLQQSLALGFLLGLVIGLAWVSDTPWIRYLMAIRILARRHELPRRPTRFLDWAYEAGLLRMAGISVQFRHRELQAYLGAPQGPVTEATNTTKPRSTA